MSTAIIEINDAGLRAAVDNRICVTSPGYAVMDGNRLLIGREAQENARLLPRWTNNRFWNQLNTDPVQGATDTVRHHADLAFAHLEQLWQELDGAADRAVFAVPGFYDRQQLGLVLGMAKECGIPVAGLADAALAAVAGRDYSGTVLHLDIYLHRVTLTVLKADSSLRRVDTLTVSDIGLFTLWDRWANTIANQFIQTSRYDPMHQAVSEQRLFDALPGWIAALGSHRTHAFELDLGESSYQVAVSQEQLLAACTSLYPQIVQLIRQQVPAGERVDLFISDRFRGFPGLTDSLSLITNADLVLLPENSVFDGIDRHLAQIASDDGSVSHTISLPLDRREPASPKAPPASARPTHLLAGHHAIGIGAALPLAGVAGGQPVRAETDPRCIIARRGADVLLENAAGDAVTLNGQPAPASSVLRPGDSISIDGTFFTLISVD